MHDKPRTARRGRGDQARARAGRPSHTKSSQTPTTSPENGATPCTCSDVTEEDGYRTHERGCPSRCNAVHSEEECEGHPAGPYDPMGQTVYCDGSCRRIAHGAVTCERTGGHEKVGYYRPEWHYNADAPSREWVSSGPGRAAKHTRGPWVVDDHADATGTVRIVAPNEGHIVAEGIDPCDGTLIAAAPDLLASLKEILFVTKGSSAILDRARAAIAKAEGVSHG